MSQSVNAYGLRSRVDRRWAIWGVGTTGTLIFRTRQEAVEYKRKIVGHKCIPRQQRKAALAEWQVDVIPASQIKSNRLYCLHEVPIIVDGKREYPTMIGNGDLVREVFNAIESEGILSLVDAEAA